MMEFKIEDDFVFRRKKPFKILSSAIHYFRISRGLSIVLYNLKALGFNSVRPYVAWVNLLKGV